MCWCSRESRENQIRCRIRYPDWIPDLTKEKSGVETMLLARFDKKLTIAGKITPQLVSNADNEGYGHHC